MKYIEVVFTLPNNGLFCDLLVDTLGNEGLYESFEEMKGGLKAYVPVNLFDETWLRQRLQELRDQFSTFNFQFSIRELEDKDWNEEWEKGQTLFFCTPKSLWLVTAAIKDACSLEEKL